MTALKADLADSIRQRLRDMNAEAERQLMFHRIRAGAAQAGNAGSPYIVAASARQPAEPVFKMPEVLKTMRPYPGCPNPNINDMVQEAIYMKKKQQEAEQARRSIGPLHPLARSCKW